MASIGTLATEGPTSEQVSVTYAGGSCSSRTVKIRQEQAHWGLRTMLSSRTFCDDGNVQKGEYLNCCPKGWPQVDIEHLKCGKCN